MDHGFVTRSRQWTALAAAAAALLGSPARAATDPAVQAQLQALMTRLQQLEQRNSQLEAQVRQLQQAAPPAPAVAPPAPAAVAEPGWGKPAEERLSTLEQQVRSLARPAELVGQEDSLTVEGGLLALAQQVNRGGSATGRSQGRLNYRGDVELTLPLGTVPALGEARFTGFGHLRFGQGTGVALRPTHSATANSIAFEGGAGSDETYAIVAQAWGQFEWPLEGARFNDLPGDRVELTLGKMDVFGFFDQNTVAGDEGAQFLNNVFVHNPLLDSGGDIAADAYGLAPGARLAYIDEGDDWGWGASLGVFASGTGAGFNAGPRSPLLIGQLEWTPKQINGEARGNYRLYAWTNGQTTDLAGLTQRHSGYGLSVDQKLGAAWNVFGRWGQRVSGDGAFDRALTLGFEHGGRRWGRPYDTAGLAVGWVRTDGALRSEGLSGQEQLLEAYYRFRLNDHLELSPDLQWIRRAGGDGQAPDIAVFGLRAAIGF